MQRARILSSKELNLSHCSATRVQQIKAAVLRRKGSPLKIETLELEGPRDDESWCGPALWDFDEINRAIADARHGDTIKPVLRNSQA